ncbi:MAG: decaprenyl-phosphate phosphoribosyltransferase [Deltaproteobacteria bacterium]|nr:MAG: decaprenyl-phosphate phosphoribosyltransferase [Deltaproteobacteria bacterium]
MLRCCTGPTPAPARDPPLRVRPPPPPLPPECRVADSPAPTPIHPQPARVAIAAIRALRPKQWVKNVLLLAALVFSQSFLDLHAWLEVGVGIASFSLMASCGYLLNDARDVEADRKHPRKRHRPIASGALPLPLAWVEMGLAFALGLALAWWLSPAFFVVVILYFITTVSYSMVFKHIVILDVMMLAACYLWRAAAGAVAIEVEISPWLLTCTAFLALFLGFNKRRGELMELGDREIGQTRRNLADYTHDSIVEFQAITTSGTIISYALYTVLASPTPWLLITLPYVLYGVFRYIWLVNARREGAAPDETLLRDVPILVTGALYGLTAVVVLLLAPHLPTS